MDVEVELDSLRGVPIDWNEDNIIDSLPTPSPLDSPNASLHEPELQQQGLESKLFETLQAQNNENPQIELAPPPMPKDVDLVGSVVAAEIQAQTIEPSSNQLASSKSEKIATPTVVMNDPNQLPQSLPNSSVPPLNETQSGHPSLSTMGFILDGAVSSVQVQDTQMGSFNGNLNMFEDMMGMLDEHNISNPLVGPNVMENNNFSGINYQLPPYPELFHPNPTEAILGTGTEHSSGQFSTDQISADQIAALFQNPIINTNDTAWNSIGLEPYSHLQHDSVTMPPNPDVHDQHGYTSMLSQSATPAPPLSSNYGQQPSLLAMTSNSFDLGSSVPPMYPQFQDDQDNYQFPQLMMPNGQEQQGVVPSLQQLPWPQVVANQMNEYNDDGTRKQSDTLHAPKNSMSSSFTSSGALSSRIVSLSGTGTTQGTTTSQAVRHEIASTPLSTNEVAASTPLSTNEVAVQCDKAKLPESFSTTSAQPSEAIRRILNMNPNRKVTRSLTFTPRSRDGKFKISKETIEDFQRQKALFAPQRRGRPPKRRDAGESTSNREKLQKGPGKVGTTVRSQPVHNNTPLPVNEEQNTNPPTNSPATNPTNPSSAPRREFVNTVYDLQFERDGVPLDPHLRWFKPPPPAEFNSKGVLRNNVPGLLQRRVKCLEFTRVVELISNYLLMILDL
ncbi:hypothetical protein SESBI_24784 [Sesbania bispinosa]|nr:hypothetical protein SESBI_24784 [Sesbania bispinosa]